ncbi:hypothetical protein PZA11_006570 [Diplocarpon coronariae]
MPSKTSLLAAVLHALPAFAAVHEKLTVVPRGWSESAVHDDAEITLSIGLAQRNIDQLESKLMAVSTPGGLEYGKHLDFDATRAMFAPSGVANRAVQSWLKGAGIRGIHSDGHWVSFTSTVKTVNTLLDTRFAIYNNNGVSILRTTEYSIPDDLAGFVDLIFPTTYFGEAAANTPEGSTYTKRAFDSKISDVEDCKEWMTPNCIKRLYSVGDYKPDAKSGSRIGFGSFLNQSSSHSDLFEYEKYFGIPQQASSVALFNGATTRQDSATAHSGEVNVDAQILVGVSHPLPLIEHITAGSPPINPNLNHPAGTNDNEPYLSYFQNLLSQPNSALPQVITISYNDDEQTVPKSYADRVCNMIGMLGLRGVSVLNSSGNNGVGTPCMSNDGEDTIQFTPSFPSTCPYITSVGGTKGVSPEVAWDQSSGGFSNYFSQPRYQKAAVENYLANHISVATKNYYQPYTNFKGRGFPDISAHSVDPCYLAIVNDELYEVCGTSTATSVVAGIIGLLNDARLRINKSPLGFINPLLYSLAYTSLNDITEGGSVGCKGVDPETLWEIPGAGIVPYASWNATEGWDPVTGLGTPDFQRLKRLVLSI